MEEQETVLVVCIITEPAGNRQPFPGINIHTETKGLTGRFILTEVIVHIPKRVIIFPIGRCTIKQIQFITGKVILIFPDIIGIRPDQETQQVAAGASEHL